MITNLKIKQYLNVWTKEDLLLTVIVMWYGIDTDDGSLALKKAHLVNVSLCKLYQFRILLHFNPFKY